MSSGSNEWGDSLTGTGDPTLPWTETGTSHRQRGRERGSSRARVGHPSRTIPRSRIIDTPPTRRPFLPVSGVGVRLCGPLTVPGVPVNQNNLAPTVLRQGRGPFVRPHAAVTDVESPPSRPGAGRRGQVATPRPQKGRHHPTAAEPGRLYGPLLQWSTVSTGS